MGKLSERIGRNARGAKVNAQRLRQPATLVKPARCCTGLFVFKRESAGYIQSVAASAEEQNTSMQEISTAADNLSKMAEELQGAVRSFKHKMRRLLYVHK